MSAKKTSKRIGAKTPSSNTAKATGKARAAGAPRGVPGSEGAGAPVATPGAAGRPAAAPAASKATVGAKAPAAGTAVGRVPKGTTGKAAANSRVAQKPAKARTLSGLDAAAQVLARAGRPMRVTEVMAEIQAKGLWATKGATPKATIYAAIIREIAAKGNASRFKKTDRGTFTAKAG